jgi:hypothetical protein
MIQIITGSLEGTKIVGAFGKITATQDVQVTITGSFGQTRISMPKKMIFTDTGQDLVSNTITEVVVWGNGSIILQ